MSKVHKTIGSLHKLQPVLLHPALVTICKALLRPHLDFGGIIYDQVYKEPFHQS